MYQDNQYANNKVGVCKQYDVLSVCIPVSPQQNILLQQSQSCQQLN